MNEKIYCNGRVHAVLKRERERGPKMIRLVRRRRREKGEDLSVFEYFTFFAFALFCFLYHVSGIVGSLARAGWCRGGDWEGWNYG